MLNQRKLSILLAGALFAVSARADSFAYVVTDTNQFGAVDLTTGAFHQIGADTPSQQFDLVAGGNGSLLSITTNGDLESINTTTGLTSIIGATGLGGNIGSLAAVGGTLYLTDLNNNLYTVNATTGAAHLIGATGIAGFPLPPTLADESLYGVGAKLYSTFDAFNLPVSSPGLVTAPALYQINTATGSATEVASTMLNLSASVDVNGTFYVFKEGLADPTCMGPSPVPCTSDAEVFTLNLANGSTSFVTDVDLGSTAIYGAAPMSPEPGSLALVGIGITVFVIGSGEPLRSHTYSQKEKLNDKIRDLRISRNVIDG